MVAAGAAAVVLLLLIVVIAGAGGGDDEPETTPADLGVSTTPDRLGDRSEERDADRDRDGDSDGTTTPEQADTGGGGAGAAPVAPVTPPATGGTGTPERLARHRAARAAGTGRGWRHQRARAPTPARARSSAGQRGGRRGGAALGRQLSRRQLARRAFYSSLAGGRRARFSSPRRRFESSRRRREAALGLVARRGALHRQRGRQPRAQPLERQLAVARLAAGVLRGRPDHRPAAGRDAALVLVAQRPRARHVEDRLDPGGGHVGVLAARAGRAAGAQLDLRQRDGQTAADSQRIVHLAVAR